jgi:N-acetylmuramoyl-L-alanine amidase
MFKLALGAGHGNGIAGKRCHKSLDPNETREWWLNDRICDYIEDGLKDFEGVAVLRLDDSDDGRDDIALAARVAAANTWGADFYLSIHHNALGRVFSGGGIVAYTHPKSSSAAVRWRNELYAKLIEDTGLRGNRATPRTTGDYYVLRKTTMPAVLLEMGFMDSNVDVPIILTDDYARKAAAAIVDVIVDEAELVRKPEEEPGALYRVQVGAFSSKANAEKLRKDLAAKGFQAYIKRE